MAERFVDTFPLSEYAGHLMCFEANEAVEVLREYGQDEAAENFLQEHAEADQHGDLHHECTEECA